jgi:hypothetical protein
MISENYGCGIVIYLPALNRNSKPVSIKVYDCTIFRNKQGPLFVAGKDTKNLGEPRGEIRFSRCRIDGQVKFRETQTLDIKFD